MVREDRTLWLTRTLRFIVGSLRFYSHEPRNGKHQPPPSLAGHASLTGAKHRQDDAPRLPAPKVVGCKRWLGLIQQGLPPCKKRQASLGALTVCVTGRQGKRQTKASISLSHQFLKNARLSPSVELLLGILMSLLIISTTYNSLAIDFNVARICSRLRGFVLITNGLG